MSVLAVFFGIGVVSGALVGAGLFFWWLSKRTD